MRIPKTEYKTTERQRERANEKWRTHPEYFKNYYREHREVLLEKARLKRLETPEYLHVIRKSRYGLVKLRFDTMYMVQCGKCAICQEVLDQEVRDRKSSPVIDHDHDTDRVRGLLCGRCNSGIGLLKDDPVVLRSAAEYIKESDQM